MIWIFLCTTTPGIERVPKHLFVSHVVEHVSIHQIYAVSIECWPDLDLFPARFEFKLGVHSVFQPGECAPVPNFVFLPVSVPALPNTR